HEQAEQVPPGVDLVAHERLDRPAVLGRQVLRITGHHPLTLLAPDLPALGRELLALLLVAPGAADGLAGAAWRRRRGAAPAPLGLAALGRRLAFPGSVAL